MLKSFKFEIAPYLQKLISYAANGVVLSNGKIGQHIIVPNVRSQGVSVLVGSPLKLCDIGVSGANKLVLHMLKTFVE